MAGDLPRGIPLRHAAPADPRAGRELPATFVIPCSAEKLPRPAPARDLYTGPMYRHTLAAAEAAAGGPGGGRILILSARHGLICPGAELEPYEQRIGRPGAVSAGRVTEQARDLGIGWESRVFALLPRAYFRLLDEALRPLGACPADVYEGTRGVGEQRRVNSLIIRRFPGSARAPGVAGPGSCQETCAGW